MTWLVRANTNVQYVRLLLRQIHTPSLPLLCVPSMEKLVQVSEQEVRIDFSLNRKCRANVRLTSLSSTCPVAFKVQTSSPHKFLVKPPTGLIPPMSYATFQVVLKPQSQIPTTYPRSPSDRFLIKTAEFVSDSTRPESINSWFNSSSCPRGSTRDLKLKVAFIGPFLLRHAVSGGECDAVRHIIRRQRTILAEFPPWEAESLLRVATELVNPENMINLLLEAGLRIEEGVRFDQLNNELDSKLVQNGLEERRVAEASDRLTEVVRFKESGSLNLREKGNINGGTKVLGKSSAASKDTPTMSKGRRFHNVAPEMDVSVSS